MPLLMFVLVVLVGFLLVLVLGNPNMFDIFGSNANNQANLVMAQAQAQINQSYAQQDIISRETNRMMMIQFWQNTMNIGNIIVIFFLSSLFILGVLYFYNKFTVNKNTRSSFDTGRVVSMNGKYWKVFEDNKGELFCMETSYPRGQVISLEDKWKG